jgi:hypothetical protein
VSKPTSVRGHNEIRLHITVLTSDHSNVICIHPGLFYGDLRIKELIDESTEKPNRKDAKGAKFLKLPDKNLCVLRISAVKSVFFQ